MSGRSRGRFERRFRTRGGFSVDRFSRPEADRPAGRGLTTRRSDARRGSIEGASGESTWARRPGARAASRTRGNGARRARASRGRERRPARALPRGSGGGEKHIRRRGASERGEATLGGADRAAPVTRIGRARDAPELRHGERSVCAETTVCAFARGRRAARRPLITCRTIDCLRCFGRRKTPAIGRKPGSNRE